MKKTKFTINRYYYNIDRGFQQDMVETTTYNFDEIHCISSQCNIGRAYMMFTLQDSRPEHINQFITDCQTKIATDVDDAHMLVHNIQDKLKEQGFPVEFFNLNRRATNNGDNPFISGNEDFFNLPGSKHRTDEPSQKTFTPVRSNVDPNKIFVIK